MITLDDLCKFTTHLLQYKNEKITNNINIQLKLNKQEFNEIDNLLFEMTNKPKDQHKEAEVMELQIQDVHYNIILDKP